MTFSAQRPPKHSETFKKNCVTNLIDDCECKKLVSDKIKMIPDRLRWVAKLNSLYIPKQLFCVDKKYIKSHF